MPCCVFSLPLSNKPIRAICFNAQFVNYSSHPQKSSQDKTRLIGLVFLLLPYARCLAGVLSFDEKTHFYLKLSVFLSVVIAWPPPCCPNPAQLCWINECKMCWGGSLLHDTCPLGGWRWHYQTNKCFPSWTCCNFEVWPSDVMQMQREELLTHLDRRSLLLLSVRNKNAFIYPTLGRCG